MRSIHEARHRSTPWTARPGGHVDTVQLLLDTTGDVGGVVNVGIYDDNAGQPSTMLAASVGQVHDSQLSGTASVFTFSGLGITTLTAGDRYWLELSDPNAGLANASGLEWYYAADASGINVGTEFSGAAGINSGLALPNGDGTSSTSQPYMMCISSGTDNVCRGIPTATPEPATLGILGIGLAALGLLRHRRSA